MNTQTITAVVERAVVSFAEAFFAYWAAAGFKASKIVLAGAVGAGASVVYNLIVRPLVVKEIPGNTPSTPPVPPTSTPTTPTTP